MSSNIAILFVSHQTVPDARDIETCSHMHIIFPLYTHTKILYIRDFF